MKEIKNASKKKVKRVSPFQSVASLMSISAAGLINLVTAIGRESSVFSIIASIIAVIVSIASTIIIVVTAKRKSAGDEFTDLVVHKSAHVVFTLLICCIVIFLVVLNLVALFRDEMLVDFISADFLASVFMLTIIVHVFIFSLLVLIGLKKGAVNENQN